MGGASKRRVAGNVLCPWARYLRMVLSRVRERTYMMFYVGMTGRACRPRSTVLCLKHGAKESFVAIDRHFSWFAPLVPVVRFLCGGTFRVPRELFCFFIEV